MAATDPSRSTTPEDYIDGKSCIRFQKVEDIDLEVLGKILKESEQSMRPLKNS